MLVTLSVIAGLLFVSAFFSGSETALTAASKPVMHQLEQKGESRATTVNRLHARKERLLGAILLGNNLVNILASALATSLMIATFGEPGVAYATITMTLLILVFAEILPKTYAFKHANRVALIIAPAVNLVVMVLTPLTAAVNALVAALLKLAGIDYRAAEAFAASDEELRGAIELHDGDDSSIQHERAMLRSVLDLGEVQVGEIMVHRTNLTAIDTDLPVAEVVSGILDSPYTRMPLWREDPDNVIGVLHAKSLLRELRTRDGNLDGLDVTALAAEPWFVPEQTLLLDQLEAFRARREHFALVVDEYGSLMGVVTLEDILEEIVGDIDDEHDHTVTGVQQNADGNYTVNGTVTIRDLNREFEWGLPDEAAATIAGLVLHESRRIPEVGQSFMFHSFRFDIIRREQHKITQIRITPPPDWAERTASRDK
ncbi:MAG: Magnesium and cobalt efflux protein CorC [Alphaproteobacteria bacterium MarineAlpha3_Bin4]|nr:MAG: Magnesium and cobalt efflux protein CorC [Alphaproteobacteria bacterium MarineAlpha3_Bin4]